MRDSQVRFVIVGAHALAVHGVSRWTGDLDVLVEPSRENAARLGEVELLREAGVLADE
ncbi:MAG: hypothetical protein KF729_00655 [Sandaracinaceae bacterium]|nr:hypothetical protein [Sandaracinaceae bacterium]